MLARHAAQTQRADLLVNRCKEALLPNVNLPQRQAHGPRPSSVFGASALAPTLHDPLPPQGLLSLFLSDKLSTRGINLHFSVPATIVNSWAKKATKTSHLFWEHQQKCNCILKKVYRKKALQPVLKRYLRPLKTPEIKMEWAPETGHTHAGTEEV